MLTKDLIRFTKRKDRIFPRFIDPKTPSLLELAKKLIRCFEQGIGHHTAKKLQEISMPAMYSEKDLLLTKGLFKLLMDRSIFDNDLQANYHEFRQKIFIHSNALIKKQIHLENFQKKMRQKFDQEFVKLGDDFYNDLPENFILKEFKPISNEDLLDFYNISLVQSLLLYCDRIEVQVEDSDTSKYRNLFRVLKFNQLLGTTIQSDEKDNQFKLIVDGPMSILENNKKYGIKLASFFPHICEMTTWSLQTEIHLTRTPLTLAIGHSSGLKNLYRRTHFIPEELELFKKEFNHNDAGWVLTPFSKWLHLNKQNFILPDFTIINDSGEEYHIELFHRWYASPLLERLSLLEEMQVKNVIVGVDHSLTKKRTVKTKLSESEWFKTYGFSFREIPIPRQVIKVLKKLDL